MTSHSATVDPALNTVNDAVRQVLKLDWWPVLTTVKDVWKCSTMVAGEQYVMICSAISMHLLPAFSLGWGRFSNVTSPNVTLMWLARFLSK